MKGLTVSERQALILSVGTHRSGRLLAPTEVARLLAKSVSAGNARKHCSEFLGLGMSQVGTFLRLNELDPAIQDLADWRGGAGATIAFSTLAHLAALDPVDQVKAAKAILAHRITRKETEQVIQIRIRSQKSIEESIEAVLKLRPQVETQHVLLGAINIEPVRKRLRNLTQRERDERLQGVLADVLPEGYSVGSRLSTDSFTIISQHDLATFLGMGP